MRQFREGILLLTTLLVTSCGVNPQPQSPENKTINIGTDKASYLPVKISNADITELEKEYSFKTKSFSIAYLAKKLTMLIGSDNGAANGTKLVRELEFARIKTETQIPFRALLSVNPALYNILAGIPVVNTQRTGSPPFETFMADSNPYPGAPAAGAATAVTATGFTANWGSVAIASSGYVITVKKGATTVQVIDVPGQASISQSVTSLTPVTTYTYTVEAKNGTALSPASGPITVNTLSTFNVSTFAGTGAAGSANGTSLATFDAPSGLAVDSFNNIYVGDSTTNKIRKIDVSGNVTTIAGSGTAGSLNAVGTNAQFNGVSGIAIDSLNNIYVADFFTQRIRKIDNDGIDTAAVGDEQGTVTTFAGTVQGTLNGAASIARFNGPVAVAVDSADNVYVADHNTHLIRKITKTGTVSTIAGIESSPGTTNGVGTVAQFNNPVGLVLDSADNIYVADFANNSIRKIDNDGIDTAAIGDEQGTVTTFAGGTRGNFEALGTLAQFGSPHGLAVDSANNVYFTDRFNFKIRKLTPSGNMTTLAGFGTQGAADGNAIFAQFYLPMGLAIDSTDKVYVADNGNNKIRKIQ